MVGAETGAYHFLTKAVRHDVFVVLAHLHSRRRSIPANGLPERFSLEGEEEAELRSKGAYRLNPNFQLSELSSTGTKGSLKVSASPAKPVCAKAKVAQSNASDLVIVYSWTLEAMRPRKNCRRSKNGNGASLST